MLSDSSVGLVNEFVYFIDFCFEANEFHNVGWPADFLFDLVLIPAQNSPKTFVCQSHRSGVDPLQQVFFQLAQLHFDLAHKTIEDVPHTGDKFKLKGVAGVKKRI